MQRAPSSAYRFVRNVLAFLFVVLALKGPLARSEPLTMLKGTIADMMDGRVENATIELISTDEVLRTNSNAAGQFQFVGLVHGRYELRVTLRGFKLKTIESINVADKDVDLSFIRLEVASTGNCSVTSWVSYENSINDNRSVKGSIALIINAPSSVSSPKSVEEAKIELLPVDADQPVQSGHPDKSGHFQFRNVEPGIYLIRAFQTGFDDTTSANFYVTRKDQTKVILSMLKSGEIFVCM